MKFSRAEFPPLRRVGLEHLSWKEKVLLEKKSNAVYLCLRSIERSVAEGKVQPELIPSLMELEDDWMFTSLTSVRTPSNYLQNVESGIQVYEKFPSKAFQVSDVHGQRRAYKAPWAITNLNLYQVSAPTPRPTKQKLTKSKENSGRNHLAKRRETLIIQRLFGSLKSYRTRRTTNEILSPRYQQSIEKTHIKGNHSMSSRKDLAICMHVPYPQRV